jgi:hypothetical protein
MNNWMLMNWTCYSLFEENSCGRLVILLHPRQTYRNYSTCAPSYGDIEELVQCWNPGGRGERRYIQEETTVNYGILSRGQPHSIPYISSLTNSIKQYVRQSMVADVCNPSYSGGRDSMIAVQDQLRQKLVRHSQKKKKKAKTRKNPEHCGIHPWS